MMHPPLRRRIARLLDPEAYELLLDLLDANAEWVSVERMYVEKLKAGTVMLRKAAFKIYLMRRQRELEFDAGLRALLDPPKENT